MKIAIRKKCFETNSSSNHTLIITNEEDLENDKAQFLKEEEDDFFAAYGNFCKPLKTKEEKCYFMADLFHKENKDFGSMEDEYEVFIQVLKDNNEEEILKTIEKNREDFYDGKVDEPQFCNDQYFNGCLIECNCPFYRKFRKYFNLDLQTKSLEELLNELETKGLEQLKKEERENKPILNEEKLYKELYKFIYEDGIIVPYESV